MAAPGTSGAAGRAPAADRPEHDPQRGAGRPHRSGQDDAGRGAARRDRDDPAGRSRRGRHDGQRLRRGRAAPAALGRASPWRPLEHDGIKVNLLDTPGYADFVGELRAGLRAADAALFVVSAVDGVDGATQLLWEECAAVGMPRAVVVTKLDKDARRLRRDRRGLPARLRRGRAARSTCRWRRRRRARPAGSSACCPSRSSTTPPARASSATPTPSTCRSSRRRATALIEGIIAESEDETLMDRYLGGEDIDVEILDRRPGEGRRPRHFYPVLAAATADRRRAWPSCSSCSRAASRRRSSTRCPPVTDPDGKPRGPLSLRPRRPARRRGRQDDVRPVRRPHLPRPRLLRHAAPGRDRARVRARRWPTAGTRTTTSTSGSARCPPRSARPQRTVGQAIAGDIVAVAKLTRAETGDTLSDKDDPLLMEPWLMPDPLLPVAVVAHSKADEDKLVAGPGPARRRGPDDAAGAQPRDPPARPVVHGRGARRRAARPAARPLRRRRSTRCRCGCRCARRSPARPRATAGT